MKWMTLILFYLCASLQAQANTTQFFYQADGGQHVFEPATSLGVISVETPNTNNNTINTGLSGAYEYGFMDGLAARIRLGYASSFRRTEFPNSTTTDDTSTAQGLEDIEISLKGYTAVGSTATIRYGLDIGWSPQPNKFDTNGNVDNQMTGQNDVTPYAGVDFLIAKRHRVGGKLQREFLLGDQIDENPNGTQSRFKGGEWTRVGAFYEFNWNSGLAGVSWTYLNIAKIKNSDGVSLGESNDFLIFDIFANFRLNERWTLVPSINSFTYLSDDVNGTSVENYTFVTAKFAARMTF